MVCYNEKYEWIEVQLHGDKENGKFPFVGMFKVSMWRLRKEDAADCCLFRPPALTASKQLCQWAGFLRTAADGHPWPILASPSHPWPGLLRTKTCQEAVSTSGVTICNPQHPLSLVLGYMYL